MYNNDVSFKACSFRLVFIPWECGYWQSLIQVSLLSSENSTSPVVEAGGSHGHMSPEEHYRRMMSALSEQGSYEEQQQRLYQLASSMGLPGHGQSTGSVFVGVCIVIVLLTVMIEVFRYLLLFCYTLLYKLQCTVDFYIQNSVSCSTSKNWLMKDPEVPFRV